MNKTALYTTFAAASLAEVFLFLTASTYFQFGAAIVLYIPLVYLALKIFPRSKRINIRIPSIYSMSKDDKVYDTDTAKTLDEPKRGVEISDIDRRAFLKLIGAMGVSFFVTSLLTRNFGSIFGRGGGGDGTTSVKDKSGKVINPAERRPTDNYKISEIDYGLTTYYGFIDQSGGWFILQEDTNAGTYRYLKGERDFKDNWGNRKNLKYDYFNRVFPNS